MLTTSEIVFYVLFSITLVYSVALLVYFKRQKRAAEEARPTVLVTMLGDDEDGFHQSDGVVDDELAAKREAPTPKFIPRHDAGEHPIVTAVGGPYSSPSVIVSQTLEADQYPRTEETLKPPVKPSEWVATNLSSLSEAELDYLFEEDAPNKDYHFADEEEPTPNLEATMDAQTRRLKITDIPSYALLFSAGEPAEQGGADRPTLHVLPGETPDYDRLFGVSTPARDEFNATRELQIPDLSDYSERVLNSRRDQTINADLGGNDEE